MSELKASDYTNPRVYIFHLDKALDAVVAGREPSGLVQMPAEVGQYLRDHCWCGDRSLGEICPNCREQEERRA